MNGPEEVKQHVWLRDVDWQALLEKRIPAPYVPSPTEDNFDEKQANGPDKWQEENEDQLRSNGLLLRRDSIQNLFQGYYFDSDRSTKRPTEASTIRLI